jgi:integrase
MAAIQKRISDEGKISYRARVRLRGYPIQSATFERLTDARKWAAKTETEIREGRHFPTVESQRHTLAEAIDRYLAEVMPHKPRSSRQQTPQLKWWKKKLGDYRLFDVTPALIVKTRTQLQAERKISTATSNRYIAALGHVFTVAVKEWGWMQDFPTRKIARLPEPRGRVRFLDKEKELPALLKACKESPDLELHDVVIVALCTGCRKQEVLDLKWADVDFARGQIVLHETKNKQRRTVPLVGRAFDCLNIRYKTRRFLHSQYIFPQAAQNKPIDIDRSFAAARTAAADEVPSLEDFRFHDLRHTAASYLAMNGASVAEIAAVLGHKTLSMVQRYAHLSDAHTSAIVQRMNTALFEENSRSSGT